MAGIIDEIKYKIGSVLAEKPNEISYKDMSSYIVIIVLIVLVTLFLLYLILNVNSKMNSFMKIYNDEQKRQYKDLDLTFNKIHKSNENLQGIIESAEDKLGSNINNLDDIEETINENKNSIGVNHETLNKINDNITIDGDQIFIGKKREFQLSDDIFKINLENDQNLKLCNSNGGSCSRIISKNYLEDNLPLKLND